ncbi:MAG: glyoxalase [Anaerolineae bacterium]|nr:MAG: glyoxalase [Anaerolineae bacterium]WKZ43236.1 MAG: VOC family protein [Anaerolineales bacterium]
MTNRSMPPGAIIPELAYPDVRAAADWLCQAFGFSERLQIGNHRAQLVFGGGSIIVTKRNSSDSPLVDTSHAVMVCVDDVDAHYEQAKRYGAKITNPPKDYEFGERQYSVEDPGGHHWVFSQSIADVDPQTWGGILNKSN